MEIHINLAGFFWIAGLTVGLAYFAHRRGEKAWVWALIAVPSLLLVGILPIPTLVGLIVCAGILALVITMKSN